MDGENAEEHKELSVSKHEQIVKNYNYFHND